MIFLNRGTFGFIKSLSGAFFAYLKKDKYGVRPIYLTLLSYQPKITRFSMLLMGKSIEITDPYWSAWSYREIFTNETYFFKTSEKSPLIIDCGANIGLSILYFKHLYPEARIIAFEPGNEIFQILERNLTSYKLRDVKILQNAVWSSESAMNFLPHGSVGGRLTDGPSDKNYLVKTVRLRDYLNEKIDFLKIDIEGAEYEVLCDCRKKLHHVSNIFVEYHSRSDRQQNLDEILAILTMAGFRYHISNADPEGPPFIEKLKKKRFFDLQLNIFGYRE